MSKTKKLIAGAVTAAVAIGFVSCSKDDTPDEPTGYDCDDWDWDADEGTYYCDDNRSTHYGSYYLLGRLFANKGALKSSSIYKSHMSTYKSGIGSGTKGGFGG